MREAYGDVASEYYDAAAHPTASNLRAASLTLVERAIQSSSLRRVCELGAGRSVFLDVRYDANAMEELVLVDTSPAMLDYSQSLSIARFVVADAAAVALPDDHFDLIVSSLGDPYNTAAVWKNMSRILRPGGHVIYTAPALEWARSFRTENQKGRLNEADFLTEQGALSVPSFVLGREEQVALWRSCGIIPTDWMEMFPAAVPLPHSRKILNDYTPFCIGASGRKAG